MILLRAYIELLKPRILTMQFISLTLGYLMAAPTGHRVWVVWGWALLGTALVSGGAAAWNHAMEWRYDSQMDRTRNRPIPKGIVTPMQAYTFGTLLCLCGESVLFYQVNPCSALLAGLTALLYLVVYTPLKRVTWWNTFIGAIPGAIPPLGGWAAATGSLNLHAWSLFLILWVWQLPHFFAIAWMYMDDYAKAGFRMLSGQDPKGTKTTIQILFYSAILIFASLWPVYLGLLGKIYAVLALMMGVLFLKTGIQFAKSRSKQDAKAVLKGSVYYLPALLGSMLLDYFL